MTAEFQKAFRELESLTGDVGRLLVERFSRAGHEDVAWFRERYSMLSDAQRMALFAAMVESAEVDFELSFADLLRSGLTDPLPAVRRLAIEGLWEDERLDLLRLLIAILESDPSDAVRAAAATSLGRYVYLAECEELDSVRGTQARAALERAASGQAVEVARRAIESLAYINDESIIRLIDQAYAQGDPLMRQSAVFSMGRSADRFWAETVLAELHGDDPAMRYEAARAAGEMRLPRALPVLARLIASDRDVEVQSMAVWAMGEIGGKRAQQLLERLVEGDDEALSAAAQETLEGMSMANPEFDMLLIEPDDEQSVIHHHAQPDGAGGVEVEDADEDSEESGADDALPNYRRQFEQYTDEDDDSEDADDDEDWPDEFFELS